MANKKTARRALFSSVLALILCCCMLVGTTFAWFTDSVTSAGNKIQSGTLKVDLELLKDGVWTSIKDSNEPIFNYDKWEPGYTQVEVLKIENEGTLALKWLAKFQSANELSILADVIDVYVCPSATEIGYPADRNLNGYTRVGTVAEFVNTIESTTNGSLMPKDVAGSIAYLGIALKMQESAGNEYQNLDLGGAFDIMILATQETYEKDSFDDQYDKDAGFAIEVSTGAELAAAIADGKAVELTQDINLDKIDLTDAITNDVVINANGHKITTTESYGIEVTAGKNVTISNADVEMTKEGDYITYAAGFKIANGDYAGATITLKDCTITMANTDWAYAVTMPASVKNLNLVIDNCTLEGAIAVQCWGDNNTITITNSKLICNYTTNAQYTSYCVVLQSDGTNVAQNNTLKIDNCAFQYSGVDNYNSVIKAAADIAGTNTVTVTNCTYGEKVVAK